MTKEQLIDRYAQTLKSWVGTGLAKDECIGLIKNAVDEALFLYGLMPSLSQEVECVCGWEGKKGNLYYRERNKEFNIGAKLECPKCYTELVSEPN